MLRSAFLPLFLGCFGLFGFFAHGYIENADADITMHAARAWCLRGSPGLRASGEETWPAERAIAERIASGTYGMIGADGLAYVWFPIGHQAAMVPCAALGAVLGRLFPEPERIYERARGPVWGQFWWTRFLVSLLPAAAAAGTVSVLVFFALGLGCTPRQALLVAAASSLCTQMAPGATETLSDGPGGFCLLTMAALVLRYLGGSGGTGAAFVAGLAGSGAVLLRYPHALPVAVLAAFAGVHGIRQRRWRHLAAFAAAAVPCIAFLLAANWLRFRHVLETGYSAGANPDWWNYPFWLGIPAILLAPGKGILLFSPPLWLSLPRFFRGGALRATLLAPLLVFVLPLVLFGHTGGWAAGQCWSVRYMTPSVVLLVAAGLAHGKPWLLYPRLCAAVCALGLLVSLGGLLAPYRGQQDLAFQAVDVLYPDAPAPDNNVNALPRLSPLHTHWIYAFLAASGRLEQGGSENTTEPLFGVRVDGARLAQPGEDAGFRHWWMVFAAHQFGMPLLPVLAVWWALTALLLWLALRRLLRAGAGPTPTQVIKP